MARIIITDLTRMQGDHICLAGYRLEAGVPVECIRPEFRYEPLRESWLHTNEGVLRPFSIAEFDLLEHRPVRPHTEDWIVGRSYRMLEAFAADKAEPILASTVSSSVKDLYGGQVRLDDGWFIQARTGARSLGTVLMGAYRGVTYRERPEFGKWDYRLRFADAVGDEYSLSVTDLAFRYALNFLRDRHGYAPSRAAAFVEERVRNANAVYLRVGLARPFGPRHERCYLQVTGVHTFPDYLRGKCHADFAPEPPDLPNVIVPF